MLTKKDKQQLLKKPNVVGTGIGEKWVDGKPTGQSAIIVFVEKKHSDVAAYSAKDLVPSQINGIPTDVVEVGKITKQSFRGRIRPVRPGYSVGHGDISAGTIGGMFRDADNDPVILSNAHVIANENAGKVGDIIFQPGPADGSGARFAGWTNPVSKLPYIGTLKKFVRIKRSGNVQDSAIARLHHGLVSDGMINAMYPVVNAALAGFAKPVVGEQVQKCGRTTGHTTGRIIAVDASFPVSFDLGTAEFNKCVVMTRMSQGGDSGSIFFNSDMKAVALLFAGSSQVTLGNDIRIPQKEYGLKLWRNNIISNKAIRVGDAWAARCTPETELAPVTKIQQDRFVIEAPAHVACYWEHAIDNFTMISCQINTGTDKGMVWGPGLAVQWPDDQLQVNLPFGRPFGSCFNSEPGIPIGMVKPGTDYHLRIRRVNNTWVGEVLDAGTWYTVITVSRSATPDQPVAIKVGKIGSSRRAGSLGDWGRCTIRDIRVR